MGRAGLLALIDATMYDLRRQEIDDEAHTHFNFTDERTEVNLDLSGALESALEVEERVTSGSGRPLVPLATRDNSWVDDLLVREEFADFEEELPLLDSGEFVAVPRTDDLRPPERGRSIRLRKVSLIAPEPPPLMWPMSKVPRAAVGANQPIRVIVGEPIIALHLEAAKAAGRKPTKKNSGLLWISAIALWAVTMLGAWVLRMELFELIGL